MAIFKFWLSMIKSLIILTTFCLLLALDEACLISGKEIGFCSPNVLNKSSFCYNEVSSYICIPAHNKTWSSYDAFYKDGVIEQMVLTHLQSKLISEYTQQSTKLQISNNPSCYQSYKRFTCNWNFPACNPATNTSILMCQSVCNNFQTACGGTTDACSIIYASTDLGLDVDC